MAASDRRLKDDYGIVAETKEGIPLHLFKYKGEDERDCTSYGCLLWPYRPYQQDAEAEDAT